MTEVVVERVAPNRVVVSSPGPQGLPGGSSLIVSTVDTDYVVAATVGVVVAVDGCRTVTLPPAAGNNNRQILVKNASSQTVTVEASDDIDTETLIVLFPWESLTVAGTGSRWVIV